ncbi:hypothetical protein JCM3770_005642 [Rhodotorula araucariae]
MPHALPTASAREAPPHPLLAPLNTLLAALVIPLQLPSLQLATPTLLLSILEAVLETRIDDVPEAARGSWDRQHRRTVTLVLVRAIDEVLHGLARQSRDARTAAWRVGDVDIDDVVRGKEYQVAKLVAALLDIADALKVVPPAEGRADPPATAKARQKSFTHLGATLPSPAGTPTPLPALPLQSTLPSLDIMRSPTPRSPTPRRRPRASPPPTAEPATLFAPRALRAPRPAAARTPLPACPEPLAPGSSTFLAEVAAHRWRSPPPPVSPLSPRRRGGQAYDGTSAEERNEGERRSTLEVLRRRMEQATAAPGVHDVSDDGLRDKANAYAEDAPVLHDSVLGLEESSGCCDACGASTFRQKPGCRRREPMSPLAPAPPAAASSSSGYSASSSSELDDTFAPSLTRSARTPTRRGGPPALCTCARPPPPRLPPVEHARRQSRAVSVSSVASAGSKPRRVRLGRLPSSSSPRHRPPLHSASLSACADLSAVELSLHSSTDIDAHEARCPPRPAPPPAATFTSARARAPARPGPTVTPAAGPAKAKASVAATPSPYTLLLLAHRARLREKLALLERRERDRKAAAVLAPALAVGRKGEAGA